MEGAFLRYSAMSCRIQWYVAVSSAILQSIGLLLYFAVSCCILWYLAVCLGVSWRRPAESQGNLRSFTEPSRIQETALPVLCTHRLKEGVGRD